MYRSLQVRRGGGVSIDAWARALSSHSSIVRACARLLVGPIYESAKSGRRGSQDPVRLVDEIDVAVDPLVALEHHHAVGAAALGELDDERGDRLAGLVLDHAVIGYRIRPDGVAGILDHRLRLGDRSLVGLGDELDDP